MRRLSRAMSISKKSTTNRRDELKSAFKNKLGKRGSLDVHELQLLFSEAELHSAQIDASLLSAYDRDGDGRISYAEYKQLIDDLLSGTLRRTDHAATKSSSASAASADPPATETPPAASAGTASAGTATAVTTTTATALAAKAAAADAPPEAAAPAPAAAAAQADAPAADIGDDAPNAADENLAGGGGDESAREDAVGYASNYVADGAGGAAPTASAGEPPPEAQAPEPAPPPPEAQAPEPAPPPQTSPAKCDAEGGGVVAEADNATEAANALEPLAEGWEAVVDDLGRTCAPPARTPARTVPTALAP
jgi:hypothetical protein